VEASVGADLFLLDAFLLAADIFLLAADFLLGAVFELDVGFPISDVAVTQSEPACCDERSSIFADELNARERRPAAEAIKMEDGVCQGKWQTRKTFT
jgi:hypothetical protein